MQQYDDSNRRNKGNISTTAVISVNVEKGKNTCLIK